MDIFADINKMIDYMQSLEPFKYFDIEKSITEEQKETKLQGLKK